MLPVGSWCLICLSSSKVIFIASDLVIGEKKISCVVLLVGFGVKYMSKITHECKNVKLYTNNMFVVCVFILVLGMFVSPL